MSKAINYIVILALVLTLIGNFVIWTDSYNISKVNGMYSFFLIIVAACNLAGNLTEKPIIIEIASIIFLSVIWNPCCDAYDAKINKRDTLLAGYIIALIGCFQSFAVHIPKITISEIKNKGTILLVIPSILMWIGVFIFWSIDGSCLYSQKYMQIGWLATYNLITIFTNNFEGQNITFFFVAYFLHEYTPYNDSQIWACNRVCLINYRPSICYLQDCAAAFSLIFTGLLLFVLINLFIHTFSSGRGGEFCNKILSRLKSLNDTKTQLCLLFSIIALVGAILVWACQDCRDNNDNFCRKLTHEESLLGFILLVVVLLQVGATFTENTFLSFLAISLLFSSIAATVSKINDLSSSGPRAGYLLLIISAILSIFLFPLDFESTKQKILQSAQDGGDGRTRTFVGLALFVSCIYLSADRNFTVGVTIGFISLLATICGAIDYKEGISSTLYSSCYVLILLTPFVGLSTAPYMIGLMAILCIIVTYFYSYQCAQGEREDRKNIQEPLLNR